MLTKEIIIFFSLAYLSLLFTIAYWGDKRAQQGKSIIGNPYIYTLSLAVYCTAWTFYGSVGQASLQGVSFLAVYLGPTLIMSIGCLIIKKIIRISKVHRITSIADFISSRYGKSASLGGIVTIIAVCGIIPYIAVQIKAISTTYLLLNQYPAITMPSQALNLPIFQDTAFYVALILTIFAILFGTRHIDATEKHEGLVSAIAFESIIKLIAVFAAGIFITYGIYNGFTDIFQQASESPKISQLLYGNFTGGKSTSWYTILFLSMMAFLFLPRQFQVAVIENVNENHLNKATYLFPLYIFLINLFVLPIAMAGLLQFQTGVIDPDTFVLALPMSQHQVLLVLFIFLGGLSAATGMVIVEAIALSTMICNDLVMVLLLRLPFFNLGKRKDLTTLLITIRRLSIVVVLLLGYFYYHLVVSHYSLVSIGLIAFTAVTQFAPAVIGGIYWKGGSKKGATAGLLGGFFIWLYTLVLPSLALSSILPTSFITDGPFGLEMFKPYQLFFVDIQSLGLDQYSHTLFWSMLVNLGLYVFISTYTKKSPREHTQAAFFVDVYKHSNNRTSPIWRGTASIPALLSLLEQYLGKEGQNALLKYSHNYGIDTSQHITAHPGFVGYAEKLLAGALGAASARILIDSAVNEEPLSSHDVVEMLAETQRAIIHSHELEKAAEKLKTANKRLQELDKLKNDFISTVTHEMRTPLTSVRAVAEVLQNNPDLEPGQHTKFSTIIINESDRLSRLITNMLDFQKMDSSKVEWHMQSIDLKKIIENSVDSIKQLTHQKNIKLHVSFPRTDLRVFADEDKIMQVMLNLLSNAVKFCDTKIGIISVVVKKRGKEVEVSVSDNGRGIAPENHWLIFEKFYQIKDDTRGKPLGTGLGLTISKNIITYHKGKISVKSQLGQGAKFSFTLPLS